MPHGTAWMHSNMDASQLAAAAGSHLSSLLVAASETLGQINCADPRAGFAVGVEFHIALSWCLSCLLGKGFRGHFHKWLNPIIRSAPSLKEVVSLSPRYFRP